MKIRNDFVTNSSSSSFIFTKESIIKGLQNPSAILSDVELIDQNKKYSYLKYLEKNGIDANIIIKIADDITRLDEVQKKAKERDEENYLNHGIIKPDDIHDYRKAENNTTYEAQEIVEWYWDELEPCKQCRFGRNHENCPNKLDCLTACHSSDFNSIYPPCMNKEDLNDFYDPMYPCNGNWCQECEHKDSGSCGARAVCIGDMGIESWDGFLPYYFTEKLMDFCVCGCNHMG